VDVELERVVSEDEAANAGRERAARAARERVEAERKRIEEDRRARHRVLAAKVDEAVARILAEAERDVAARRAHLERWLREHDRRADALLGAAADAFVSIIRDRPRKKTL
jgi:hypothetical protein